LNGSDKKSKNEAPRGQQAEERKLLAADRSHPVGWIMNSQLKRSAFETRRDCRHYNRSERKVLRKRCHSSNGSFFKKIKEIKGIKKKETSSTWGAVTKGLVGPYLFQG